MIYMCSDLNLNLNQTGDSKMKTNYPKMLWAVHNIVAHPLYEILSLVGLKKWGDWIHDITVPAETPSK